MTGESLAHRALRECAAGTLPPNVALMHLCLHMPDQAAACKALLNALDHAVPSESERLRDVLSLWEETPGAFSLINAISAEEIGTRSQSPPIANIAARFDKAAKLSPQASVALYSLGREDVLEKATAEIVAYLKARGALGRGLCALEIGCGIGRFLAALSPELSHIAGIDISQEMLALARSRTKNCGNVELIHGNGHAFPMLPGGSFDLVLAIDVFPYLAAAGKRVTESNLQEAHRILRPGGQLFIMNYSYRAHVDDYAEIRALARETGFAVNRCGLQPFSLWDGTVFELARASCRAGFFRNWQ